MHLVAPLASRLYWSLSLLGHRTLDLAAAASSMVRGLPVVRLALVLSLTAALLADELPVSLRVGDLAVVTTVASAKTADAVAGDASDAETVLAGVFAGIFGARAPERAPQLDDAAVADLLTRFEPTAAQEAERFGLDAGVLLAAAAAATLDAERSDSNVFGSALDGPFATAWESWRAMSLSVAAAQPGTDRDAQTHALASMYPDPATVEAQIRHALQRYDL